LGVNRNAAYDFTFVLLFYKEFLVWNDFDQNFCLVHNVFVICAFKNRFITFLPTVLNGMPVSRGRL